MKRKSLFVAAFFLLSLNVGLNCGCVDLQRSPASGYGGDQSGSDLSDLGRDRKSADTVDAMAELGYSPARDLSSAESNSVSLRMRLNRAEKSLEGKRELEQYYKNKPYMHDDRERLEFLGLDSFETRQRWLNAKGIQGNLTKSPPAIQALIDVNDITVGMTKQAVRDSWGEPDYIEVAGAPVYGNERWHYTEQTSSTEGYQTQIRLVYFESGQVIGWESH